MYVYVLISLKNKFNFLADKENLICVFTTNLRWQLICYKVLSEGVNLNKLNFELYLFGQLLIYFWKRLY